LGGRRLARVAAVATLLLFGQEVDGHSNPFPKTACSPRPGVPNRVLASEAFADPAKSSASRHRYMVTKWINSIWHRARCGAGPGRNRCDRLLLSCLVSASEDRQPKA
jgi:hypothetical protein